MPVIYHLARDAGWRDAERSGTYAGTAEDRADGFLHFSTAEQLPGTLEKWYAAEKDLLLVAVDADVLGDALKWEKSRDGALFPHFYASLPLSAVKWAGAIGRDDNGGFVLPPKLSQ